MEIIDFSKYFPKEKNTRPHSELFPKNIFCIIAGGTGSGKTNLICNLLLTKGTLNYADVYIYSPSLYQPLYEVLKRYYCDLENECEQITGQQVKIAHFHNIDEIIVDPSTLSTSVNHVIVFDDVMLKDQTMIKEYFCRGRHNNVNVFYLCQSLFKISKHCIRENANIFILFRQDDDTMKSFHRKHVSGDMSFEEFKDFYEKVWIENYNFIVINDWSDAKFGVRYVANYNTCYIPKRYKS